MRFGERECCVDLCGEWSMAYSLEGNATEITRASDVEQAGLKVFAAAVPGNFEPDLQRNGIIEEPFHGMNIAGLRRFEKAHVWYFTRFKAEPRVGYEAELVFEGLDCFADVYLNGKLIGSADNMLVEHVFGVDGALECENELVVHIRPAVEEARRYPYPPGLQAMPVNWESLYVRKAPHMYGWDIMPRVVSCGIWRPVTLRYRPVERLETVHLETLSIPTDRSRASLALSYRARTSGGASDNYAVRIEGRCGDSEFAETRPAFFEAGRIAFEVASPRLWWPRGRGEANLYDVTVSLLRNGEEIDRCEFAFGIRTVRLDRTSVTDASGSGEFCFHVNGEKVFMLGSNWVPADAYHSRDAERIPRILDMAEDIGCNVLRCWGGNVYENDLFYEICDRKGIMVWQDFAMACAIYPQDEEFQGRLADEARKVVRRLRHHACIVLWSGDNECDCSYAWAGRDLDPNTNVLTREVLPSVLLDEDPTREYLPSSPYIDAVAFAGGASAMSEDHLWGPRDYFKSDFYTKSICHFASEIGYHGCPSPESIRKFISPEKLWPYENNEEWLLHCTSPVPELHLYDFRVELMAKQIRALFGVVPDNLEDYAFASQAMQAEAKKFFIEFFRSSKWRRTGIIWWNLMDGWPQFSDAVVDYYFAKKLAYHFIKRAQAPLCLVLREPADGDQALVACNDTREDIELSYSVRDIQTREIVSDGCRATAADSVTELASIAFEAGQQRLYVIEWQSSSGEGRSHYLAGTPPFDMNTYRNWLRESSLWSEVR